MSSIVGWFDRQQRRRRAAFFVVLGFGCDVELQVPEGPELRPDAADAPSQDCDWTDCDIPPPEATDGPVTTVGWPGTDGSVAETTTSSDADADATTDSEPADVAVGGTETTGDALFEACYPGFNGAGTLCLALVEEEPYVYPLGEAAQHAVPRRWIDVAAHDPGIHLAPNFILQELVDPADGDYQVVEAHAVEMLQAVREAVGALIVHAAFRSPEHNAASGGDPHSRHIYGDAFDLQPVDIGPAAQDELFDACEDVGASHVEIYSNGHVHCDWGDEANDPAFFDETEASPPSPRLAAARIVAEGNWLRVETPISDVLEGPLRRTWSAYDANGSLLGSKTGSEFSMPVGTAFVHVDLGRVRTLVHGATTGRWLHTGEPPRVDGRR